MVGDFVVMRKPKLSAHKLAFRWCGPHLVVEVGSPKACAVEDLVKRNNGVAPVASLERYSGRIDGTDVPEVLFNPADLTTEKYGIVEKLGNI